MTPEIPQQLLILKDACKRYGLSWNLIDSYSNNLVEVSLGGKSFFSSNSRVGLYPLNSRFSAQLVNDKAWCNRVLAQKKYRIPRGDYFFLREEYRELRGDGREMDDAIAFAKGKYPIFVKPNSSSLGVLAEIIHSEEELLCHLQSISEISWIALVQEAISAPEYRIFAIDGEVQFAYERRSPKIIGDGRKTVRELVSNLNEKVKGKRNLYSEDSAFLRKQLQEADLDFDSVPEKGMSLSVSSKRNLSSGGEICAYTEAVSSATNEWVRNIMDDLSIRICGIDIFSHGTLDDPNDFTIIEINQSPGLSGIYDLGKHEKVFNIWKTVFEKYFSESVQQKRSPGVILPRTAYSGPAPSRLKTPDNIANPCST